MHKIESLVVVFHDGVTDKIAINTPPKNVWKGNMSISIQYSGMHATGITLNAISRGLGGASLDVVLYGWVTFTFCIQYFIY
ncbi:hypothetical protein TSUD_367310 [Trifolium subterraneum]|uniref:Uncharacterized protein n=1 Tax=Trifolium subterraneum TaxID=3900 RepID=A0A2Z6NYR3_TRISU|nr:hypothetical protein TSUD_367310 [Trifolium subterraneum]